MEEEKKKKKKGLLVALLTLILAGGLATAGIIFGPKIFKGKPAEEVPENTGEYSIYYNLERDKYDITREDGIARSVNREDGFYHILMATDSGRSVQVRVADKGVVAKIDRNLFMGLIFDEKNICTGAVDIKDMISDFYFERWYVMEKPEDEDRTVLINSNALGQGVDDKMTWDADTKLIDVSGFNGAQGTFASALREDDRFIGILNKEGKLTHVYIIERTDESPTYLAYCEHCKENVKWKGWNYGDKLPTTTARYSHYYLIHNVILEGQQNIQKDQHICLDLKGHLIAGARDKRVYSLHNTGAELAIFDTSEEKTGVLRSEGEGDEGSVIWVRYGTFSLYGGTLDASRFTTWKSGTCMAVPANSTFNMYGGTVIGGVNEAFRRQNANGSYTNVGGLSGSIHLGGTLNMYGGTIRDGYAKEAYYTDANGKQQTVNGYGGNIYMGSRSVLNLYDGEITGGKSYRSGGNIAMEGNKKGGYGAVINMYGGKITNGTTLGSGVNGGNVSVGSGATFNLINGEVSGGKTQNCAGNIYINGTFNMKNGVVKGGVCYKDGKVNTDSVSQNLFYVRGGGVLEGGVVDGGVWVQHVADDKTNVTLSGTIKITGQKYNVYMAKEEFLTVKNLRPGANIGVYANGIFSNPTDAANRQYFHSDIPEANIIQPSGKLAIGEEHCVCGGCTVASHTCQTEVFQAWTNETSLPTTAGYYFLTKDVKVASQRNVQKDAKVVLCLNGHKVLGPENQRIYSLHNTGAELIITDCKKTGIMQCQGDSLDEGGVVWVRYGKLTLYNATLSGEGATSKKSGTVVAVPSGRSFVMMSGTIIGGNNLGNIVEKTDGGLSYLGGSGGSVYVAGEFTMEGGTIKNGRALTGTSTVQGKEKSFGGYGGNIYVGPSGKFTMNGGELKDGYADKYSGNVSTEEGTVGSTVTINGGTISGGTCKMNENLLGNLCMMNHTTLTVTGGTIEGKAGVHSEGKEMFVTFSKDAKISNVGGGFSIPNGVKVTVQDLSDKADIYVTAAGVFTEPTAETNKQYVKTVSGEDIAVKKENPADTEGALAIGRMMCVCGGVLDGKTVNGGKHICAEHEVFFEPWSDKANLPNASGNYYLTNDVKVTGQRRVSGESADAPMLLTIDLNGHTIGGTSRTFIVGYPNAGELTLLDSSEGKTGLVTRDSFSADDVIYLYTGAKMTLYGVTVDGSKGNGNAGAIDAAGKTTLTAYNSTIIGAKRTSGTKFAATLTVGDGGVDTLTDCVVKDGYSVNGGGNINVGNGTLNLIRTTVSGGQAPGKEGGNIRGYGTVLLEDSTITGGVAGTGAGILCGFNGVTVKGTTTITGNGIEKAEDNDSNIAVGSGKKVVFDGIDLEKQKFSVTALSGGVVAEVKGITDTAKALAAITSEDDMISFSAAAKTDSVEISAVALHKHCICGGTLEEKTLNGVKHICEKVEFTALADANNIKNLVSGYYYLPQDMEITSQQSIKGGAKIVLDLNGHTLKMTHRFMIGYPDEGTLIITDCSKTQSGKMTINHNVQECMFYVHQKGTLEIYGGTMDGSLKSCPTTSNNLDLIRQANGTPVTNIYGGTLIGCDNEPGKQGNGSVLYSSSGVVNIYGGTLQGTKAHNGAAIYSSIPVNIYGGEIIGGTASSDGGAIYITGSTLTMTGGVIRDGIAKHASEGGGNIFSGSSGTVKLLGGTVSGGQAVQGGNIRSYGNVYLKDVTITGGICSQNGGGIYMGSYNSNVLEISGNTDITGNTYKNGASELKNNLFLASGRKAVLKDVGDKMTFGITENDAKTSVVEGAKSGMENAAIFMDKTKYQLTYDNGTLRIISK